MAGERPLGVSIVAVVNFVLAAMLLILMFFAVTTGGDVGIFFMIALLEVALAVAVGVGLWMLRRWARLLAIGGYALILVLNLAALAGRGITGSDIVSLGIPALIILYLMLPAVAEEFR